MDAYSEKRKGPEVSKQDVVRLDDFTKRFILAQHVDNTLRLELEQLISVAMEEKLNRIVEDIAKKGDLEMILAADV